MTFREEIVQEIARVEGQMAYLQAIVRLSADDSTISEAKKAMQGLISESKSIVDRLTSETERINERISALLERINTMKGK